MDRYDLIIKNGWVVDPLNKVNGRFDVGVGGGKVQAVTESLAGATAPQVIDAAGRLVMPGIVDSHVHIPGRGIAHRAMALAGVTTAVDYGRFRKTMSELPEAGAGLNIAGLEILGPWVEEQPTLEELEKMTDQVLSEGAVGIKIMGGHHPSTPAATARMIQAANNRKAYVGYHVGSTATASNLLGLREAFELAGRNRLHLAHINAYIRGMIRPVMEEIAEALDLLAEHYWIVSETHLGPRNGTGGKMGPDGQPNDWVTRNCLKMRGYPWTYDGLKQALLDGYAAVSVVREGQLVQVFGTEAARLWEEAKTDISLSFPVNVRVTAQALATAVVRRADGRREDVIDAIATDGGAWRNFIAQNGLALVRFGALGIEDFVRKTSLTPARLYGMHGKGHLSVGADADISILDYQRLAAYAAIVGGKVAMLDGVVVGSGATIVCTERGRAALEAKGFPTQVVNIEESLFWTKGDRDPGPGVVEAV